MADLKVDLFGLQLKNPLILASGYLSEHGWQVRRAAIGGAAAVSLSPMLAHRLPSNAELEVTIVYERQNGAVTLVGGTTNRDFLTYDEFLRNELEETLAARVPFIVNKAPPLNPFWLEKMGLTTERVMEDIIAGIKRFEAAGAAACEFNIQPVTGYGGIGVNTILYGEWEKAIRLLKDAMRIPVIVKVPYMHDMREFGRRIEAAGADAILTTGALRTFAVDVERGEPLLRSTGGVLSMPGNHRKPQSLANVADLAGAVKIPVIGGGGIFTALDVIEYVMAGAAAVELLTAPMVHGFGSFRTIARGLSDWLDAHGYRSLQEIRGLALRGWGSGYPEEQRAGVKAALCTGCAECFRVCENYRRAIVMDYVHGLPVVDRDRCDGCGWCVGICPEDALSLRPASTAPEPAIPW